MLSDPTSQSGANGLPRDSREHHTMQSHDVSQNTNASSLEQPITKAEQKLTLETLPLEIKHEIFSHFLLSSKVKHSTDGAWPGYRYKFDTTVMLLNKNISTEATTYLLSHNEFALIHVKFFAFEIDKALFLPTVATGKPARSFKNPSVEATILHLKTRCTCELSCPNQEHVVKDRTTHALLMLQDLGHLTRQLQLTYHAFPTLPIYIVPGHRSSPVSYISSNVSTKIKLVWKVNPSYRQDLDAIESRKRQSRLLAPLARLVNHGQTTGILGADQDLVAQVTQHMTPRLLSVDAVGWDLLDLMYSQKQFLDGLLEQNPPELMNICFGYVRLAYLGWDLELDFKLRWDTSSVMRVITNGATSVSPAFFHQTLLGDEDGFGIAQKGTWQYAIAFLTIDCLLTAARLVMETDKAGLLSACMSALHQIFLAINPSDVPGDLSVVFGHYLCWSHIIRNGYRSEALSDPIPVYTTAHDMLQKTSLFKDRSGDEGDEFALEDMAFCEDVISGKRKPSKDVRADCKGLLRRKRISNTPVALNRPKGLCGWTIKKDFLGPELSQAIIKHADSGNQGLKTAPKEDTREAGHECLAFVNPVAKYPPIFTQVVAIPFPW